MNKPGVSWLRGALCAATVVLVVTGVAARVAVGSASERALRLVRHFDGVNVGPGGPVNLLEVNGQVVRIVTALGDLDISKVLDDFEAACRNNPKALFTAGGRDAVSSPEDRRGYPVLRTEATGEGLQACLVPSAEGPSWAQRWRDFGSTRDLATIGNVVLVYARRMSNQKVHLMKAWTGDRFRLLDMFPANGDSPGSDSKLAARPRSSRRTFSGVAGGNPYAVRIYEASSEPDRVLVDFDTDMAARGFTRLNDPGFPGGVQGYLHQSGVQALVTAQKDGSRTVVVVTEGGQPNRLLGAPGTKSGATTAHRPPS